MFTTALGINMLILPLIGLAQEEQEEEGEGEALGISNTQQESEASPPQEETPLVRVPQTSCQGRRIRRILVKGTRRVSEEDVLANIRLRAGRICTDAQISADARSLWDLGFFDHISIEGEVIGEEIEIAIHLTERPSIAKIRFEGNQGISTNDLQEALEIKEGSILSRTAIQKQVTKFRELYTEKGYFLARVQPRIEPLHEGEVNLIFSIEEGDKITVRRIRFVGNRVITSSELRGVMQTGESGLLSFLTNNDNFRRSRFNWLLRFALPARGRQPLRKRVEKALPHKAEPRILTQNGIRQQAA
ncbi:MAG: hypothetical protein N2515_03620, partial [Deltaproteobacteria bacterium]|nr:hypothetical protein [Deltaproteobacteria bacterium]